MEIKKFTVNTDSESLAVIEYMLKVKYENSKPVMNNDKYVIITEIINIIFYESSYYHSAYKIHVKYFNSISKEIERIKKLTYLFSEEEKKELNNLPF